MKTTALAVAALFAITAGISACDKHDSPSEAVKDGLDMRKHEGLKDAGEDIRDEAKDAKNKVKEEVHDATH